MNLPLNRRELITGGFSAMATLGATQPLSADDAVPRPRVSIVGAGFGGLCCAYELSRAGYLVDMFESRNRLGGRVHSVDRFAPNRVVEFGGEFIGGNHPLWLKYAQQFGIELETLKDDGEPTEIVINGHRYSGDKAKALADEVNRGHAELAQDAALADWETPWNTPDAEKYDRQSLKQRIDRLDITDRAKRAIYVEFLMDMACRPEKMNYLALMCVIKAHGVEKYWSDTEMYRASLHGNQILASHFAAGLSGRIHLDCPVTRIERSDAGCNLTIRDGRKFEYSDVVISVPPSVWKNIEFTPSLPAGFSPQMGSATKFLAVLKNTLPEGETDLMTDTPLGMTWEGATGPHDGERLLVSFAGGTIADNLHARTLAGREEFLTREFDHLLPGFDANHLKSEFIDWLDDPWTQGGYSFPLPGAFLSQAKILKEGLGRLSFAGEHASFGFFGFMEGGLHSGVQAAHRLMHRDKVSIPDT